MRHRDRIRFRGHAEEPAAVLAETDVFVYLLSPDHYGTGENALVEAMSAGAMAIVFDNPVEGAIVEHGVTGFAVASPAAFAERIEWALDNPKAVRAMGRTAARAAARRSPRAAASRMRDHYDRLLASPKRSKNLAAALGRTPAEWFAATLHPQGRGVGPLMAQTPSKGTLGHFRHCFPQDPSLSEIANPSEDRWLSA